MCVVGAGFAGLAAAHALVRRGFHVVLLEASSSVGGRASADPSPHQRVGDAWPSDAPFLPGPEWIHGTQRSPIYTLATAYGLLDGNEGSRAQLHAREGKDGTAELRDAAGLDIDRAEFDAGVAAASSAVRDCDRVARDPAFAAASSITRAQSVGAAVRGLSREGDFGRGVEWRLLQESCYCGCPDAGDLRLDAFGIYDELPGGDLPFASGFPELARRLGARLVELGGALRLGAPVDLICWGDEPMRVVTSGEQLEFDHVIVTVSLGVLKRSCESAAAESTGGTLRFSPPLPSNRAAVVARCGWGLVEKLHVRDDAAAGGGGGVPLPLRVAPGAKGELAPWVRGVYQLSATADGALRAWVVGEHAPRALAVEPDGAAIGAAARGLLTNLRRTPVGSVAVAATRWAEHERCLGSYSYIARNSSAGDIEVLASPLPEGAVAPRLLFAGEATHSLQYATTHGAFNSGLREAARLVALYSGKVRAACTRGGAHHPAEEAVFDLDGPPENYLGWDPRRGPCALEARPAAAAAPPPRAACSTT